MRSKSSRKRRARAAERQRDAMELWARAEPGRVRVFRNSRPKELSSGAKGKAAEERRRDSGGERATMVRAGRRSSRVPHSRRPAVQGAIHVVQRIRRGLPTLRTPRTYRVLERAFRAGKERGGFRLIHYSVQHDHLHLVVDADDRRSLASGMQGLAIRIAKALNRRWNRRGKGAVFADRYFAKAMTTFRQMKRTLTYVLNNGRKHGSWTVKGRPDPFSSARWKSSSGLAPDDCRPLRSPPLARPRCMDLMMAVLRSFDVNERPGQRFDFSTLPTSINALC